MPRTKCRLASAKSKDDMPPGSAPSIFQVRGAEKKRAVEFSMRVIALLASFDNLVETRVLRNPADTNEVRSGVTNRNLSTTETSFIH